MTMRANNLAQVKMSCTRVAHLTSQQLINVNNTIKKKKMEKTRIQTRVSIFYRCHCIALLDQILVYFYFFYHRNCVSIITQLNLSNDRSIEYVMQMIIYIVQVSVHNIYHIFVYYYIVCTNYYVLNNENTFYSLFCIQNVPIIRIN